MKSSLPHSYAYFLAFFGTAFFSAKAVLVKLIYAQDPAIEPLTILAMRMGISLPVFAVLGFLSYRRRRIDSLPPLPPGTLRNAFLIGVIGYYLAALLDFSGLQYISAQLERLILFTYPVFVMIFAALFFAKPITRHGIGAVLISYFGLFVVFSGGTITQSENLLIGTVYVLAAAASFAMYQLLAAPLSKSMGTIAFTCTAMGGACIAILLHFAINSAAFGLPAFPSNSIWTLTAFMAIICTVLPSFLLNSALRKIGAQAVSIIGMCGPIVTIIMATELLDEPFSAVDALGTLLIICGIFLYSWFERRRSQPLEQA